MSMVLTSTLFSFVLVGNFAHSKRVEIFRQLMTSQMSSDFIDDVTKSIAQKLWKNLESRLEWFFLAEKGGQPSQGNDSIVHAPQKMLEVINGSKCNSTVVTIYMEISWGQSADLKFNICSNFRQSCLHRQLVRAVPFNGSTTFGIMTLSITI